MRISFPIRIYFAALVLRLIPVLLTTDLGIGLDDMFQYDMLARSLASGHGFRWYAQDDLKLLEPYVRFDLSAVSGYDPEYGVYTSFRAPLYPTFLAIVYSFSGLDFPRFFAARLAQAILLGAPLAPLTYFISKNYWLVHVPQADVRERPLRDTHIIERISRLSASIVACYPMLLLYPLGLVTENLFIVLLLFSFLFLLKSIKTDSARAAYYFPLSGFLLALAALTRSVILPFAFLAFCVLLFRYRQKAFLFFTAFLAVLSPWIVRNSLLHHKLTGIETSLGYNLYLGYHPQGNGSFVFGPSLDLLSIMDDSERDSVGMQKALEFIRAQPEGFIPLALDRLGFFFGLEKRALIYFYSNNILGYIPAPWLLLISAILLLPFVFLCIFAVIGFTSLERSPQKTLLSLLILAYILPHVLILSEDRFHLALIPFFAILAAYAVILIREGRLANAAPRASLTVAVLFILLLFANWGLELARDADKIAIILGPNGNQSHFPY